MAITQPGLRRSPSPLRRRRVPEGVAVHLDHVSVVQQAVECRTGEQEVTEERRPLLECPIRRDDSRPCAYRCRMISYRSTNSSSVSGRCRSACAMCLHTGHLVSPPVYTLEASMACKATCSCAPDQLGLGPAIRRALGLSNRRMRHSGYGSGTCQHFAAVSENELLCPAVKCGISTAGDVWYLRLATAERHVGGGRWTIGSR